MSGNYTNAWKILSLAMHPDGEDSPCLISPDNILGPCGECCHCHDTADEIERILDDHDESKGNGNQ